MIMTENRSILMKRRQLIYLILITGFSSFTVGSSEFHFINESMTYEEAKHHCQANYTDLAKVNNLADMKKLTTLLSKDAKGAWTGLETQFAACDQEHNGCKCGKWKTCVCRGESESSNSSVSRSRRTATLHCRTLSLVNPISTVWIGDMKNPCKKCDGHSGEGNACPAAILRFDRQRNDLTPDQRFRFICQGARKLNPTTTSLTTTQKMTTTSQLTTYTTTLPNTSPQVVTTTVTFTAPTKQPNTTNVATEGETTATDTTTADTTDVVHSTSRTEVNNTTHEQVTSTTQSTTQLSTLTSSGNNRSVSPGNLILIQQNLTWIEAMTYCREHHNDLVQVTTREIQEEAAEKAKSTTSPHVWLGLRYTCKLNFWFWTRSTSNCYQNWAEGEGPNGTYDCEVTGAINATGGQWVGLPETDRLNFICSVCNRSM